MTICNIFAKTEQGDTGLLKKLRSIYRAVDEREQYILIESEDKVSGLDIQSYGGIEPLVPERSKVHLFAQNINTITSMGAVDSHGKTITTDGIIEYGSVSQIEFCHDGSSYIYEPHAFHNARIEDSVVTKFIDCI